MAISDVPATMRHVPALLALLAVGCDRPAPPSPSAPSTTAVANESIVEPVTNPSVDTERAPLFELPTASGDRFVLADALARGAVVLVFYRGDW